MKMALKGGEGEEFDTGSEGGGGGGGGIGTKPVGE